MRAFVLACAIVIGSLAAAFGVSLASSELAGLFRRWRRTSATMACQRTARSHSPNIDMASEIRISSGSACWIR